MRYILIKGVRPECRPEWAGNLGKLSRIKASKVQALVGANVSFEEFRKVSGVAAIAAATAQLNSRLAARGVLSDSACAVCGMRVSTCAALAGLKPSRTVLTCVCAAAGWPEVP